MKEFVTIIPRTYFHLMFDHSEHKKAKGTKKQVIRRRFKFNDYQDCLFKNKTISELQ